MSTTELIMITIFFLFLTSFRDQFMDLYFFIVIF